jgi:pimeloyl-ACP methyl ester carboxylesterase
VHTGFQSAWNEVSPAVLSALAKARAAYPTHTIVATGHSLGGAVANYFAATYRASARVPVTTYTYGSPRIGNSALAAAVDAQTKNGGALGAEYRVTHVADPVPRLPPLLFGYRHTSPELWLSVDVAAAAATKAYPSAKVKVCEGAMNLSCNGGTFGLDVDAHRLYFGDMGACNSAGFKWKREESDGAADGDDDEALAQRLQHWQDMDRIYVDAMKRK